MMFFVFSKIKQYVTKNIHCETLVKWKTKSPFLQNWRLYVVLTNFPPNQDLTQGRFIMGSHAQIKTHI